MNRMNKLAFAVAAHRRDRRSRDLERLRGKQYARTAAHWRRAAILEFHQPVVTEVTLLAGDTVDLRQQTNDRIQ